jgi:hypothetical protein
MILLWFIAGIALIFGIARYNESNKLFWTLLFCYVMGFAGTKMVLQAVDDNEKSNVSFSQTSSTQESVDAAMLTTLSQTAVDLMPMKVTASTPASQNYMFEEKETGIILSEVSGRTRDQPQLSLLKPPELWLLKSFSTLHDTG